MVVTLTAAVLGAGLGVVAQAAPPEPGLTVAPTAVRGGATVSVRGVRWKPSGRTCGKADLTAYVPGVSPYALIRIGSVTVGRSGLFAVPWRTPRVTDRLRWSVEVRQRCRAPERVVVRDAAITIG
jgi:hypothetical protein